MSDAVVAMDIDAGVAEPVVQIKSGMSQEALLATLQPLQLSDELKASVLNRLKNKTEPGKPQQGTPVVGDCVLWTGAKIGVYGQISVGSKNKHTNRAAFEVHHGVELPPNLHVRHLCANPACVEIEHLAIGTVQDNGNDKVESGRSLTGDKHPGAKLTAEFAKAIFAATGLSGKELAARYGCSESVVDAIRCGRSWSSVTGATKRNPATRKKNELRLTDEEEAQAYVKERIDLIPDEENEQHVHWAWRQCKDEDGYGIAAFHGKRYYAHNLAWRAWNQMYKLKKGECVLHGCKMKHCVDPTSLRLGTAKENTADRVRDGTDNRGVKNKRAKLDDEKVYEIRRLHSKGTSVKTLADRFRVTPMAISDVVSGKNWKHLGGQT